MAKTNYTANPEFLDLIPKCDVHLHLDGSIRPDTLFELAQKYKVKLPAKTKAELNTKLFKDKYDSLAEYLRPFLYTTQVLQTPEALERCSYELAKDNIAEGVFYIEVRFAPQLHINEHQDIAQVLLAVDMGLRRAKEEHNNSAAVRKDGLPEFEYGIIACAMRKFTADYSKYFAELYRMHPYLEEKMLYRMASLDLVEALVKIKRKFGIQIVAFDLAGEEKGYPAVHHQEAFDLAQRNFLKKTVHAGEAYGPESIFQAITDLKADRIGHGYYLFEAGSIKDENILDKEMFVRDLAQYIADRRITIEVCLTSNLQTNPKIGSIKNHAFRKMLEANLSTTLCTDNRTVSHTNPAKEIALAIDAFDLSPEKLKNIIIYGFKRSFFFRSYPEKRAYVRKIIDHYESIERRFKGRTK